MVSIVGYGRADTSKRDSDPPSPCALQTMIPAMILARIGQGMAPESELESEQESRSCCPGIYNGVYASGGEFVAAWRVLTL